MKPDTVIFNDTVGSWQDQGPPICFNNQEIRKMLKLAGVGRDDVFYDLGSGWGQNLIIALTEFKVRKAVGVESDRERYDKSVKRLKKWKLSRDRWAVIPARFEKVLGGKVSEANLQEATVVFYGLSDDDDTTLNGIARNLRKDGRLIYYYGCLFPEIMPAKRHYPFFLSTQPFVRPSSEKEWLGEVVRKKRSSIHSGKDADVSELWSEFRHDYDVDGYGNPIIQYRKRLKASIALRDRFYRVSKSG